MNPHTALAAGTGGDLMKHTLLAALSITILVFGLSIAAAAVADLFTDNESSMGGNLGTLIFLRTLMEITAAT